MSRVAPALDEGLERPATVCASRAPLDRFQTYKRRMGWSFPWVSSGDSDFNYDFRVSLPDVSAGPSQPEMPRGLPPRTDGFLYNFDKDPFIPEMPGLSAFAIEDGALFVAGIMDVAWMVGITVVLAAESNWLLRAVRGLAE